MAPLKYTSSEFHIYDALDIFKTVNIPIDLAHRKTEQL